MRVCSKAGGQAMSTAAFVLWGLHGYEPLPDANFELNGKAQLLDRRRVWTHTHHDTIRPVPDAVRRRRVCRRQTPASQEKQQSTL